MSSAVRLWQAKGTRQIPTVLDSHVWSRPPWTVVGCGYYPSRVSQEDRSLRGLLCQVVLAGMWEGRHPLSGQSVESIVLADQGGWLEGARRGLWGQTTRVSTTALCTAHPLFCHLSGRNKEQHPLQRDFSGD